MSVGCVWAFPPLQGRPYPSSTDSGLSSSITPGLSRRPITQCQVNLWNSLFGTHPKAPLPLMLKTNSAAATQPGTTSKAERRTSCFGCPGRLAQTHPYPNGRSHLNASSQVARHSVRSDAQPFNREDVPRQAGSRLSSQTLAPMVLPTTNDERFDFCFKLQEQLKPERFWITDFLAQRLMDVELTFCCGESANEATVRRCAEYCEELLHLDSPGMQDVGECLKHSSMSATAKAEVEELLKLSSSPEVRLATTAQACSAVSGFLHLVFTRDVG